MCIYLLLLNKNLIPTGYTDCINCSHVIPSVFFCVAGHASMHSKVAIKQDFFLQVSLNQSTGVLPKGRTQQGLLLGCSVKVCPFSWLANGENADANHQLPKKQQTCVPCQDETPPPLCLSLSLMGTLPTEQHSPISDQPNDSSWLGHGAKAATLITRCSYSGICLQRDLQALTLNSVGPQWHLCSGTWPQSLQAPPARPCSSCLAPAWHEN